MSSYMPTKLVDESEYSTKYFDKTVLKYMISPENQFKWDV